jgi:hypothetical protein
MFMPNFYSVNEAQKYPTLRVFHNNDACPHGRDIPQWERIFGTGGYRLCHICDDLNRRLQ